MKKWMYLISVGGLTILFSIFYLSSRKEAEAKENTRIVAAKQHQAELDAKKAADEKKARADADEREAKRKAEDKAKEDEARRKWDDEGKRIQDDTNGFVTRADKASKDSARLEIELDNLRKLREKTNREAFDSAKLVEKAEVDKQSAELRSAYLVEQIAQKAAAMARQPSPPVAATGK
jgi:hypothetical protein